MGDRPVLYLDFETRSRVDLRREGAHRYFEDPSTEVVVAGWSLGGLRDSTGKDILVRWTPADDKVERDYDLLLPSGGLRLGDWRRHAEDPRVLVVAHNAEFERLALVHKFGLRGPAAEPSRFRCTAAQAARAGLPRGLEAACEALGLDSWDKKRKDRVLRKLTQPRRGGGWWEREDAEEEWDELDADCVRDVRACAALHRALPPLSDKEQAVWELTARMNDEGLAVDLDSVRLAHDLAVREQARVAEDFEALVGAPPGSPRARALLGVESLDKLHVRRLLRRADLSPAVRQALDLRKRWARSSLAKLRALLARTSADSRLRGSLVYAGAERTARWSSRGVQWHNAPRGIGADTDVAFEALQAGALSVLYDDVLLTLSDMLKGFLVGPFLVGDYGQVEARALFWLAGQAEPLADFRAGKDPYLDVASVTYGHEVKNYAETHDPRDYDATCHIPKRQLGKIAVLGCGYGLGTAGLQRNAEKDFDLLLSDELAARVVHTYRTRYPAVVRLWGLLEQGLRHAVEAGPGHRWRVGPVLAGMEERAGHRVAYLVLPGGRRMYYFDPRLEDGDVTYFGRDRWCGGKWGRVTTYGGMLTQNVVEGVARDALAEAMLRLDAAGFPLRLTVHDEVVAEAGPERLGEFQRLMLQQPEWAPGLPLTVDAYSTRRYRK